jgi:hypothetical protein
MLGLWGLRLTLICWEIKEFRSGWMKISTFTRHSRVIFASNQIHCEPHVLFLPSHREKAEECLFLKFRF